VVKVCRLGGNGVSLFKVCVSWTKSACSRQENTVLSSKGASHWRQRYVSIGGRDTSPLGERYALLVKVRVIGGKEDRRGTKVCLIGGKGVCYWWQLRHLGRKVCLIGGVSTFMPGRPMDTRSRAHEVLLWCVSLVGRALLCPGRTRDAGPALIEFSLWCVSLVERALLCAEGRGTARLAPMGSCYGVSHWWGDANGGPLGCVGFAVDLEFRRRSRLSKTSGRTAYSKVEAPRQRSTSSAGLLH
jgi:hypothetical protein